MSWMGECQMELALEILLGDFQILQCHVGTLVAEQFHHGGEADAGTQHLSSICVSKLVRDDAGGDSDCSHDLPQRSAEPANQRVTTAWPWQQQTTGLGRSRRTQRTDSLHQLTDGGIHGNPALGFELAQWHMDGPLTGAERAQTIKGEVGTFADAYSGVTQKQQDITDKVVAAQQFLLNQLILLRSQRARQMVLLAGNIVATEQMGEVRELLRPGKVFQHPPQIDHIVGARNRGQGRPVRPQQSQPAEDMGIAA